MAEAFIDEITIHVKAGDGGNGCMSFRREKYVAKGGPNGGDGGRGGNVVLEADTRVNTLFHLVNQPQVKAGRGQHGMGKNMHGKGGDDRVIPVPPGTIIYDSETDIMLKDLDEPGARLVIAKGGRGGRGNARFKSSTNQAPRQFENGKAGEDRKLRLELKILADVGLVGLPNAGKSTLLSRLTRANPKIASYPFTTLHPHLGIIEAGDYRTIVVADLPGLIEGAHEGHGLGDRFLRHIERTRLILHLVDPTPPDDSDPAENWRVIRNELETYSAKLAEKSEILVATKMDLPDANEARKALEKELDAEILGISSLTGDGLRPLVSRLLEELDG